MRNVYHRGKEPHTHFTNINRGPYSYINFRSTCNPKLVAARCTLTCHFHAQLRMNECCTDFPLHLWRKHTQLSQNPEKSRHRCARPTHGQCRRTNQCPVCVFAGKILCCILFFILYFFLHILQTAYGFANGKYYFIYHFFLLSIYILTDDDFIKCTICGLSLRFRSSRLMDAEGERLPLLMATHCGWWPAE